MQTSARRSSNVLIQGRRYGWVPAGESNTDPKLITEMEYDECTVNAESPIPRLVSCRTTTPDRFNDYITNPQTAERMRHFRERATTEQQPYNFDTLGQVQRRVDGTGHDRARCVGGCRGERLSESEAYHLLSDADSCPTFEGAKVLLDRINPSQFTDPDLVTCIVFSKNLVEFCLWPGCREMLPVACHPSWP